MDEQDREDLEAQILEQEHRLIPVLKNFVDRKKWKESSPRRNAVIKALFWKLIPKPGIVAIGVSIISVITVYLAYQANLKLDNQNALIIIQNELQESARRSSLNIEISAIMDQVNSEREASYLKAGKDKNHIKKGHKVAPYLLSDVTAARIAAISRSLKPYRGLKVERGKLDTYLGKSAKESFHIERIRVADFMEDHLHSPEREQLFVALQTMRVSFKNIGRSANFSYLLLKDIPLRRSDFRTLKSSHSIFERCDMGYTIFDDGELTSNRFLECSGTSTTFNGVDLTNSKFIDASLTEPSFKNAKLTDVHFTKSNLLHANFRGADLSGCHFINCNLSGSDFSEVSSFHGVVFKNCIVEQVKAPKYLLDIMKSR